MSKFITIEIPEGYDRLLTFSLIGGKAGRIDVYTSTFDITKGTHLALDLVKMSEDGCPVWYNQFDRNCVPVDAEELNRLQLLEKAVIEACKKEKEE